MWKFRFLNFDGGKFLTDRGIEVLDSFIIRCDI